MFQQTRISVNKNTKCLLCQCGSDVVTIWMSLLSQRQILGTVNLPQDSAPVCINIDISPEMAAQSAQETKHFVSRHLVGP